MNTLGIELMKVLLEANKVDVQIGVTNQRLQKMNVISSHVSCVLLSERLHRKHHSGAD